MVLMNQTVDTDTEKTEWKKMMKMNQTVDASMLPPNQTAYLCIWWEITCTSIGFGCEKTNFNDKVILGVRIA